MTEEELIQRKGAAAILGDEVADRAEMVSLEEDD